MKTARKISNPEFKRRVFNECLTRGFMKLHADVIQLNETDSVVAADRNRAIARAFFKNELNLDSSTIATTKKNVCGNNEYTDKLVMLSEEIAENKAAEASEANITYTEDDTVELSAEDKNLLDTMFERNKPETEVDTIRQATVDAISAEDAKSHEINDALNTIKTGSNDSKTLEETVMRLTKRGPTSLMNAIMSKKSEQAIKDVLPNNTNTPISSIMSENADRIISDSFAVYTLYETINAFGFKKYTPENIRDISYQIYFDK